MMAGGMQFKLVSPERLIKSGEVEAVTVPGSEGDFTAMPGHAPVLSSMRPGVLTITETGGDQSRVFIRGGFAEISDDGLTVLAEEAVFIEDLNDDKIAQEIKNAEEDVTDARDDATQHRAQEKLDHLRELQSAL